MNDPDVKLGWKIVRALPWDDSDRTYEARAAAHSLVWTTWQLRDEIERMEMKIKETKRELRRKIDVLNKENTLLQNKLLESIKLGSMLAEVAAEQLDGIDGSDVIQVVAASRGLK